MAHLARAPTALAAFASNCGTYSKISSAYAAHIDKAFPNHTAEEHAQWAGQYLPDEAEGLVVAEDLPISREDFSKFAKYGNDIDLMTRPLLATAVSGGVSLFALPFWANATHKLPSTFFSSEEEIRNAGKARDQEVHIKHGPTCGFTHGRFMEFFVSGEPKFNEAFDSITNGFTAPKDPVAIRKMSQFIAKQHKTSMKFKTCKVASWKRAFEHFEACAFLGKPYLGISEMALCSRIIAFYRTLLQEDFLIKKEGVASINDLELYEICNRRLIARWEEDLSRAELEARLENWMTFTEIKEGEMKVPITLMMMYQTSFMRDPGFLDDTLESLDEDAFPSALNWSKDVFERRVEFESGPLADQVRAHLLNLKESEEALTAERAKYLEAKNA